MKISELFLERLFAPVLIKGDLTVLPGMIQKEFGLKFKDLRGGCLASQFIFTLSDISGIPPQKLVDAVSLKGGMLGLSFEALFDAFDGKTISVGKKKVKFDLSLQVHSVDAAMAEVSSGQPVTTIVSGFLGGDIDANVDKNGILKKIDKRNTLDRTEAFHALLLIGFDKQEGTLIFREMRNIYAFSGYAKIPMAQVKKNKGHFKFISTVVDDFKEVK